MEQITHSRTRQGASSPYPIPKLPRFVVLVLIVLTGFTVANIGMRAMGQYTVRPPNPFSAFADVFPGEPASAIEAHDFSCVDNNYYGSSAEAHCFFQPAASAFSSVDVLIYQDTILKTTFLVGENLLQVGDLAVLLETNELQTYPNQVAFVLLGRFVIAQTIAHDGGLSPFLPVWSVSFIDKSILN